MKYNKKFEKILAKLETIDDEECQSLKKEIEALSLIYKKKDERLHKIIKLSDKQQMAILELNEELDSYKNNLEKKVQDEMEKRVLQEELLFEQSRLAAMAEMIDAVAHQWMQPLNILHMNIDFLDFKAEESGNISASTIKEFKENSFTQIRHLIDTLDNFRQFFRPLGERKTFSLQSAVTSVVNLIKDELIKHDIDVNVNVEKDFFIMGNENEFKHIILNLISNAKYAFMENEIKEKEITVNIFGDKNTMEIIDNAGGIDESIIDDIFQMHVSSKGEDGSGIGLYMSAQIAKKHNGELRVENVENGAKFTFTLKDRDNGLCQ